MVKRVWGGWLWLIGVFCVGLVGSLGAQTTTAISASKAAAASGVPAISVVMPPMAAAAPLNAKIFPLADVRRGLHGVAYTVFEGVTPEPMEVEILGVLTDAIGP